LSTPSVVSRGEVHKGLAIAASICPPLVAGRGSHFLGPSLSGGKVHHQDPLCLERGLMLWRHVQLDRGSGLLASKLASPWHCLWLGGGLPSMSLHLLTPLKSVALLEGEAGVRPRPGRPRWSRRHGLSAWSVLRPWCGCDRSGWGPRAVPLGNGEAEAPLPTTGVVSNKLKFSKGFHLFLFKIILFEFIFNLKCVYKAKRFIGVQNSLIWIFKIFKQIVYFEFTQNHSKRI
jgi:hypothetical protein